MSERWRETYDQWKLATPPEYEGEEEDFDDLDRYDDDDMEDADEWVLDCGVVGCCMPEYHFRSECHTPEMIEAYENEVSPVGETAIFEFLCRKYTQRADERQKGMGLQYTTAETHDLAREIAAFIRGAPQAGESRD